MKLLIEGGGSCASSDYLFARIRCRRGELLHGKALSGADGQDPHALLRAQYNWVYSKLNRRLHKQLLAVFEYLELRTLVIALRCRVAGEQPELDKTIRSSLMHPQLIHLLRELESAHQTVAALEARLAPEYACFENLTTVYLRQGPGGLEQHLIGRFLQHGCRREQVLPVRIFFRYLVDMRNLLAIHKHLRWQVEQDPPLVSGGQFELKLMQRVWETADQSSLQQIICRRAAAKLDAADENPEKTLLDGLTRLLARLGRDPLQVGLVLDYLWRCRMRARDEGLEAVARRQTTPAEVLG